MEGGRGIRKGRFEVVVFFWAGLQGVARTLMLHLCAGERPENQTQPGKCVSGGGGLEAGKLFN